MKTWRKGAIYGFLFIPLLFLIAMPLMYVFAILRLEALAGMLDGFAMLPFVPMSIVHEKLGITGLSFIITSLLFWTLIGAVAGYFIGKK